MKTKTYFIIILFLTTVFFTPLIHSQPGVRIVKNKPFLKISPRQYKPDVVIIQQVKLDPNRISTYYYNKGIFNQDLSLANTPGFEWPKDSNTFACFTAGLCIAAKINGQLRQAMASYQGEYAQGYIDGIGGPVMTDSRFKIYWIKSTDNAVSNPDYLKWIEMIPFGAPYVDVNNNGQYDPGIDKPGIKDAEQTLFACLTDGFPEEHSVGEGFGGGTQPVMAQVQLTAWGYNRLGLEDVIFVKWDIINKNSSVWDSLYMSIVVDPDLGWADDDYVGCDTSLNLGYCYNGDDDDDIAQSIYAYGLHPPAFGMDFFRSPVNFNVNPPDTLGLTSFVYFICTGCGGPPCVNDPNGEPVGAYNFLKGIKKDRTPWYNPLTGLRTEFCYPGDPESGIGWTEFDGSVLNCNGDSITSNNVITTNPPYDARFIMNTGADNFRMNPGDTQTIILAQLMARGSNNLNSVTKLKELDRKVQYIFDKDFNVISEPIPPRVNISYKDKGYGRADIVL
nr:hypothetical protein [Bacteroidota bacterium]